MVKLFDKPRDRLKIRHSGQVLEPLLKTGPKMLKSHEPEHCVQFLERSNLSLDQPLPIQNLYSAGSNSERIQNSDGRWRSVFEWSAIFF